MAGGRTGSATGGLDELYRHHVGGAVRLAFLLTGDRELAEDVVQDAFVRVAGRFHHLRRPDAFEAYLRRAVVNLCASHHRKTRVARAYLARAQRRAEPVVDLPEQQVAEILGCSVPAARSLVARAMVSLRERVGGEDA